jgi:hypothetical protein
VNVLVHLLLSSVPLSLSISSNSPRGGTNTVLRLPLLRSLPLLAADEALSMERIVRMLAVRAGIPPLSMLLVTETLSLALSSASPADEPAEDSASVSGRWTASLRALKNSR